jgi:ankyrin repeat protein
MVQMFMQKTKVDWCLCTTVLVTVIWKFLSFFKAGANVNASGEFERRVNIESISKPLILDLWSFTSLHEAASKSQVEFCSLLISEGADINFLNCHNKSPLGLAPRELQERMRCEIYCDIFLDHPNKTYLFGPQTNTKEFL